MRVLRFICLLYTRITSSINDIELFYKYQTIQDCIRSKGKVLEKLYINIGKHELVDSADAYKDGDWQEILCT